MTGLVTLDKDGQSAEALGHPDDCTEPAPGEVSQYQSETNNVTVTNANGDTQRLAARKDANLKFPSHSHDYSELEGCHDDASHTLLPPESKVSSSVTIDGSPVFVVGSAVETDPKTGGNVNIVAGGINSSVGEQ